MSAADVPSHPARLSGREITSVLAAWPARRWLVAAIAGAVAAIAIGIPTGVVETSLYTRMTPVVWWNYPVWAISSVLAGLTAATYVPAGRPVPAAERPARPVVATVLSAFAVGCPVCNKLVVGLVGASGALSYWAPLQPILGVLAIAMLAVALVVRVRGEIACAAPWAGGLTAGEPTLADGGSRPQGSG